MEDGAIALADAFCACFEISFRGRRWLEPPAPIPHAVPGDGKLILFGAGVFLFCERIGVDNAVRGRTMEVGGPITEGTAAVLGLWIGLFISRNAVCFCEKGFDDVNSGETPEQPNSIRGRGVLCKTGDASCCFGDDEEHVVGLAGAAGEG